MSEPYIGQIDFFPYTFAPLGYFLCDGTLYPIQQYQALYALISNTYGGTYQSGKFAVPNLMGQAFVGLGTAPNGGQIQWTLGRTLGRAAETITGDTMPAHSHALNVLGALGTDAAPAVTNALSATHSGETWAAPAAGANTALAATSLAPAYSGPNAHTNMQPFTVLRACIAWEGIFPTSG